MVQIREATAKLRFVLADIEGREKALDAMIRQARLQLDWLSRQAMYGRTALDIALSAMGEIEERLEYAQKERQHLLAIKHKAADELSALELTDQVEQAKMRLMDLVARRTSGSGEGPSLEAEVRRLEEFIAEYSKRAERAITSAFQEADG